MSWLVRYTGGRQVLQRVRGGARASSGLVERFPYEDGTLYDVAPRWYPWSANGAISSGRLVTGGADVNYCRCNTIVFPSLRLTLDTFSVNDTDKWYVEFYTDLGAISSKGPNPANDFRVYFEWDAGTGVELTATNDGGAAWSVTDTAAVTAPADGSILQFDVSRDGRARAEYADKSLAIDFSAHTDSAYAMRVQISVLDFAASVEFDNLIVRRRAYT